MHDIVKRSITGVAALDEHGSCIRHHIDDMGRWYECERELCDR